MASSQISFLNFSFQEKIEFSNIFLVKGVIQKSDQDYFQPFQVLQKSNNNAIIPHRGHENFVFCIELIVGENAIEFRSEMDGSVIYRFVLNYSPHVPSLLSHHKVVPLLVLCTDTKEQNVEVIIRKIELAMKIVQNFFMQKLLEHGFGGKWFELHPKTERVTLPISKTEVKEMNAEQIWEYVACHIKASTGIWSPYYKYSAFILDSCKKDFSSVSPDKIACGGGGLSLLGFNSFEVWPLFPNEIFDAAFCESPLETEDLTDLASQLGTTRTNGALYCASLGAIAHELGHIFDLGHSESGLMGKEYSNFSEFFEPIESLRVNCFRCGTNINPKMKIRINNTITLTHSSASILNFHRWFNPIIEEKKDENSVGILYDKEKLVSKFPITAVEIRQPDSGLVIKEFALDDNCFEITLFKQHIPIELSDEAQLFAQNSVGDILKVQVFRSLLKNSFTQLKRKP